MIDLRLTIYSGTLTFLALLALAAAVATECDAAPTKKPASGKKAASPRVFVPLPPLPMMAPLPTPLPGMMPGGMPIPSSSSRLLHCGGGSIGPDTAPFHQWSYDFESSAPMAFQVPTSEFEKCLDKLYAAAHPGQTFGMRDEGAMARIGFYLMRDGSVTGARILESSTNPKFKTEALNLVRKVHLPKGWQKGPSLVVCELTIYGGEAVPTMDPEPENGAIP